MNVETQKPTDWVVAASLPWLDFPEKFHSGGVKWKLIHTDLERDTWTVLFFGPAGSSLSPHMHEGCAEGWQMYGRIVVHEPYAAEGPGYIYEYAGAVHPRTNLKDDTEFFLTMHGNVIWIDEAGGKIPFGPREAKLLWEAQQAEA
ncbi:hypothetical protein SAMN05443245_7272 [Paraburkholderia fungorum]|uniref:ChrR-like cupin domain-containing protein n=1 Tax=Paraburkholderia fungorum TaxID=134537 RepID=A0A1H1JUS1_9BURK|nr:hypothetical protein [Paraburkholderia fungorum]SDR53801.1 hypothetical protein SAMN05443245_7272 [Paraburkholderia fungorum]